MKGTASAAHRGQWLMKTSYIAHRAQWLTKKTSALAPSLVPLPSNCGFSENTSQIGYFL